MDDLDAQTKANTAANAGGTAKPIAAVARDEVDMKHEGLKKDDGGHQPKVKAIEPTDDRQGNVPPSQERGGYVADAES
ncbi:hypothetical protein WJX73_010060 [Symbiochloris irregularis]|uniref:Uncharacterized protein n=1 Tax=Symbiochloris irregularis TaxID=706552 RepID=A0AAW1PCY0_9CHLO